MRAGAEVGAAGVRVVVVSKGKMDQEMCPLEVSDKVPFLQSNLATCLSMRTGFLVGTWHISHWLPGGQLLCGSTGQDGEGKGRGRGRARGERQARGRGERKAAAVAAASGNAADPTSPVADIAAEGHAQEQPRRGRRGNEGRARGGRDSQSSRGRGRAGKSVSSRTGPAGATAISTTSVAPAEAPPAPGNALASSQEAKTTSADPVVVLKAPTAAPASVLPAESTNMPDSKAVLEPPAMPPGLGWDAIAPEPPGLGWGRTAAVPPALEGVGAAGTFPPTSKPVASSTVVGPDPPVERPKSAAGVVSRPRSSGGFSSSISSHMQGSTAQHSTEALAELPLQQHVCVSITLALLVLG